MRYKIAIAATVLVQVTASFADAPMSPAVKAHLCNLAKRDAAFTPAQIEAMDRARAECIASQPPVESGQVETTCKAQGARRTFGTFHKQASLQCNTTWQEKRLAKKCPHKTDYLADADARVARYCTDNPQRPAAKVDADAPESSSRF